METYILMGICLVAWGATVGVIKLLMRDSDSAFLIGSLAGLMVAVGAGFAYYSHLASSGI